MICVSPELMLEIILEFSLRKTAARLNLKDLYFGPGVRSGRKDHATGVRFTKVRVSTLEM
jgi:hypothetical protein